MKKELTEKYLAEDELMEGKGTSLVELFGELSQVHEALGTAVDALAVLERGADSPEMAGALSLLWEYMRTPVDDLGALAAIGSRAVAGSDWG